MERIRSGVFGSNLRAARQARQLSQAALARQAGIRPDHVWRLERGRRVPKIETAKRLAEALNISLDVLTSPFGENSRGADKWAEFVEDFDRFWSERDTPPVSDDRRMLQARVWRQGFLFGTTYETVVRRVQTAHNGANVSIAQELEFAWRHGLDVGSKMARGEIPHVSLAPQGEGHSHG